MADFFSNISKEQITILKSQIERFEILRKKKIQQVIPKNKLMLPEKTLIHGTSFDIKKLESIASSGIITGQYFGIEEDGETYFCADFHRVDKDTTLEEYNNSFSYKDGRCPFGSLGKNTIAFIIPPNKELEEITKYDCYREGTKESIQAKTFVNEKGLPIDDKNKASSILFGIPSNFIKGIVIGDNLISKENISIIRKIFPNCYLTRNNGKIIYKQNDTEEMTNLRIEAIEETIIKENKTKEIELLNRKIDDLQKEKSKLWESIAELPLEEIAKIYELIGWQGDYLEFARRLKENNEGGRIR